MTTSTFDSLYDALNNGTKAELNAIIEELHPSEIANILESLPTKQRLKLWRSKNIKPGEILPNISENVRIELMLNMSVAKITAAAESMAIDDAVDILQDLPDEIVEKVLQIMNWQYRQRLTQVLFYPEDSAGGLMNTDVLAVRTEMTLKMVLRYLRRFDQLPADALMVVDCKNCYRGMLFLTDILINAPRATVEQVMSSTIEPISAHLSAHEVAILFEQRDLLSVPVIDDEGILMGRITIDDVVDVIRSEADHNLMGQAGLNKDDDMFAPILTTTKNRALWLGVNLATAFLAAYVIGFFTVTLEKMVALAVLMPVVASMGGIAGSQTLTIVIRAMALNQISGINILWLLKKELAVGILNGIIWAVVVAVIAMIWFGNIGLGIIIGCALLVNLSLAALSGVLIPFILNRLSIDPALASGVTLTTITDVIGFGTLLGLASIFLF